jgi:hypothetical protein
MPGSEDDAAFVGNRQQAASFLRHLFICHRRGGKIRNSGSRSRETEIASSPEQLPYAPGCNETSCLNSPTFKFFAR